MVNKLDYVELGLFCADVCRALDRGTNGRRLYELSQSVLEAIGQLTTWVEQVMHIPGNPLTKFSITGPLRGSKGRSLRREGEFQSLGSSMRRMIRKPSLLGS